MNAPATPDSPVTVREFARLLPATRRGARQARLLAAEHLRAWTVPAEAADRVELVVAELAANAVLHGRCPGRDFRLALSLDRAAHLVRIEVTDARPDRLPPAAPLSDPAPDGESGRGLLLVAALAERWGSTPCPPAGKTVWAECHVPAAGPEGATVRGH